MTAKNIAGRYGRALFDLVSDEADLDLYCEQLLSFSLLLKENQDLRKCLMNPFFTEADRRAIIDSLLERMEITGKVARFILLLSEKRRLELIPDIAQAYRECVDGSLGRIRVYVEVAAFVSSELASEIRSTLQRSSGKKVEMVLSENPSLIGGMVVRIRDVICDGSLKTQIELLKERLSA